MKNITRNTRLRNLYQMMGGIPADVISMDMWRTSDDVSDREFIKEAVDNLKSPHMHSCGTAACALGWAASYPKFKRDGLRFNVGYPTFNGEEGFAAGAQFFGISLQDAEDLFESVDDYTVTESGHKRVFLQRLRELMVDMEIITPLRSAQLALEEVIGN